MIAADVLFQLFFFDFIQVCLKFFVLLVQILDQDNVAELSLPEFLAVLLVVCVALGGA